MMNLILSYQLRPEYQRENFGQMVRGKYAKQVKESSNIIVLDPDVASAFGNALASSIKRYAV